MKHDIDISNFSRKSPYLKVNLIKYAPEHEIPKQTFENKLPLNSKHFSLIFNNQNNISVQ